MINGAFLSRPNKLSSLIVDRDLNLGAFKVIAAEVDTDVINEKTAAAKVSLPNGLKVDSINEYTAAAKVSLPNGLKADSIDEYRAAAGVTADGVLLKDSAIALYPQLSVVAGTGTLLSSLNTELTTTSTTYGQDKSFTLPAVFPYGSKIRVSVQLKADYSNDYDFNAQVKISLNGVEKTVVQQPDNANAWLTATYDFTDPLKGGDVILLQLRSSYNAGLTSRYRNARLYATITGAVGPVSAYQW